MKGAMILSSASMEHKLVLDLSELLQKNAHRVLSGKTNLCLTTSSLSVLTNSFHIYNENKSDNEATSSQHECNGSHEKQILDLNTWRENVKILYDFVHNIKALKIIQCTHTLTAPIQIARFRSVQVLEIRKIQIHMLEGLSKLRSQLRELIVSKSIETLKDLLEMCGGDRTPGLVWSNLKTAHLSFNGLHNMDESLSLVPFVEVLDLSHNNLMQSEAFLKPLTEILRINLGYNLLSSVPSFPTCKVMLKTLVLRNNNLDSLDGIQEIQALEELDVSENFLTTHTTLNVLLGLNKLQVLCLTGNPLSYKSDHRLQTVRYISVQAGLGIFLLDGKRLSDEELVVLHQNLCKTICTTQLEVPVLDTAGSHTDTIEVSTVLVTHLTPNHHRDKNKNGHRRFHIKELLPKIVDIVDGQAEESSCHSDHKENTLPSSYTKHPEIENEKQCLDTMRNHYQEDWLKVFSIHQETSKTTQLETQSSEQKQQALDLFPPVATQRQQPIEHEVPISEQISHFSSEQMQLSSDQKQLPKQEFILSDKQEQKTNEKLIMSYFVGSESAIAPTTVITVTSPTSLPLVQVEEYTDIYTLQQTKPSTKQPADHELNEQTSVEDIHSSEDSEKYGNSESFIVMLPTDDMEHIFVIVNNRFIIERSENGVQMQSLDLKYLQSIQRTEEACYGKDIIGGLTFIILTLNFDFVKKDKRLRKYAMEDDNEAKKFESLIVSHLKTYLTPKDLILCLRCQHKFVESDIKDTTREATCPKCKSKLIIKSDTVQIPQTSTSLTPYESYKGDSDTEDRLRSLSKSSQKSSSRFERKQRSDVHEVTEKRQGKKKLNIHTTKKMEPLSGLGNSSSIEVNMQSASDIAMRKNASWSDPRQSSSTSLRRGSYSSLESDISVLASGSASFEVISESGSSNSHLHGKVIPVSESQCNVDQEVSHGSRMTDSDAVIKLKSTQGVITPAESSFSNSVRFSMVSSVYEKTLGGEDTKYVISVTGNPMECSQDSVTLRQSSNWNHSATRCTNRNASVFNEGVSVSSRNGLDVLNNTDQSLSLEKSFESTQGHLLTDELPVSRISNSPSLNDAKPGTEACENSSSPLRERDKSVRSPNKRSTLYGDIPYLDVDINTSNSSSQLSVIKRSSSNRKAVKRNKNAVVIDSRLHLAEFNDSDNQNSNIQDVSGSANVCPEKKEKRPLPWELTKNASTETAGENNGSLNHDEFFKIDHRLQLYLELKVFEADEICHCAIQCAVVQYMNPNATKSLLVVTTNRILIFRMEEESDSNPDWLKCYENQQIQDLQYIDIGLGYQSLRLEYETEHYSYTLLIGDEERCKQFLKLLRDVIQKMALKDDSKLEGISKALPTTMDNLEKEVLNPKSLEARQPQHLVRCLMVKYMAEDSAAESAETMSLVITETDVVLVKENHQWVLPRLQATLLEHLKGRQFTVIKREKINSIKTLMFNEYNPKELRLTFFDASQPNSSLKSVWIITMETLRGVKSLVDAIRVPWEEEFKLSLDTHIMPI